MMDASKKHTPRMCSVAESTEGNARLVVSCSCGNAKQYHGENLRVVYFVCDGLNVVERIPKAARTRMEPLPNV
jgi:hypothetical protein